MKACYSSIAIVLGNTVLAALLVTTIKKTKGMGKQEGNLWYYIMQRWGEVGGGLAVGPGAQNGVKA